MGGQTYKDVGLVEFGTPRAQMLGSVTLVGVSVLRESLGICVGKGVLTRVTIKNKKKVVQKFQKKSYVMYKDN